VPLLELPQAQFVLMSATLGEVERFQRDITRRTGRPTAVVSSVDRPVPLTYRYAVTPLHETLEELLSTHQAPVYVVHFTQAAALERAQALTSLNVCSREEKDKIAEPAGQARHRRAPRRHAAQVPPAGRATRPVRPAQGDLRNRHPGCRHQRADPHRRADRAEQVRRTPATVAQGKGVPPDRGPRRSGRVRHLRHRGRPGTGPRGGEREGPRQGR